jgi:hypothetical protein
MCRKLIEAGYDLDQPLEAYRGEMLCLRVSTIGYGAKFTVKEDRRGAPVLRSYEAFPSVPVASPMRPNECPTTQACQ